MATPGPLTWGPSIIPTEFWEGLPLPWFPFRYFVGAFYFFESGGF